MTEIRHIIEMIDNIQLNEIGDNPYPVKLIQRIGKYYKQWKTIDGKLQILIMVRQPGGGPPVLEINFYSGGDGNTEMTGLGDEFRIMSTVVDVLRKNLPNMIKVNQPKNIAFYAKSADKGRIKLYRKRGVQLISSIIGNNWNYNGESSVNIKGEPYQAFTWSTTKEPEKMNMIGKFASKF